MIRIVGDNSFIGSGLFWRGPSSRILAALLGPRAFEMLTTEFLLGELLNSLRKEKFADALSAFAGSPEERVAWIRSVMVVVQPVEVVSRELRDPNDLPVLAAAVGGHADLIVTGDKDLLVLKSFQGIGIVTPVKLLHTLGLD